MTFSSALRTDREDVGLALVVAVGTDSCSENESVGASKAGGQRELSVLRRASAPGRKHTEIDLLAVGISLESFGDTC